MGKEKKMKIRQKITLCILLYSALCGAAFAQVIHIPDPNLRVALRESLNLPPRRPFNVSSYTEFD